MGKLLFIFISIFISFCGKNSDFKSTKKTIYIQPLGGVEKVYIDSVKSAINKFYGYNCVVLDKLEFTNDILSQSQKRYDANKILKKYNSSKNTLVITEKDITHRKGNISEWGILGLGFQPGKICVISTFRCKKNVTKNVSIERLKKVALHEIGHNLGLPHCGYNHKCLMNDARGTIKQVDKNGYFFCKNCQNLLN